MGNNRVLLFNDKEKWCPGCEAWLPLDEFHNLRTEPSGKRTRCKKCFAKQNAPHVRKYKYGLSDEQLEALWEKQGRRCAICKTPILFRDRHASHIDHDHKTKVVRGILCSGCNLGLGWFRDNPGVLEAAIEYLKDRG